MGLSIRNASSVWVEFSVFLWTMQMMKWWMLNTGGLRLNLWLTGSHLLESREMISEKWICCEGKVCFPRTAQSRWVFTLRDSTSPAWYSLFCTGNKVISGLQQAFSLIAAIHYKMVCWFWQSRVIIICIFNRHFLHHSLTQVHMLSQVMFSFNACSHQYRCSVAEIQCQTLWMDCC